MAKIPETGSQEEADAALARSKAYFTDETKGDKRTWSGINDRVYRDKVSTMPSPAAAARVLGGTETSPVKREPQAETVPAKAPVKAPAKTPAPKAPAKLPKQTKYYDDDEPSNPQSAARKPAAQTPTKPKTSAVVVTKPKADPNAELRADLLANKRADDAARAAAERKRQEAEEFSRNLKSTTRKGGSKTGYDAYKSLMGE